MSFKIGFLHYALWVISMWAMGLLVWFWAGPALTLFLFHDPRLVPIVAQMNTDWIGIGVTMTFATLFGLVAGWSTGNVFD